MFYAVEILMFKIQKILKLFYKQESFNILKILNINIILYYIILYYIILYYIILYYIILYYIIVPGKVATTHTEDGHKQDT